MGPASNLAYRAEAEFRRRGLADQHAAAPSVRLTKARSLLACHPRTQRAVGCPYPAVATRSLKAIGSPCRGPRCGRAGRQAVPRLACTSLINRHERLKPSVESCNSFQCRFHKISGANSSARVCLAIQQPKEVPKSRMRGIHRVLINPQGECERVNAREATFQMPPSVPNDVLVHLDCNILADKGACEPLMKISA